MAANMNVCAALGSLPSLPPGSIKTMPLPSIGRRANSMNDATGDASPKKPALQSQSCRGAGASVFSGGEGSGPGPTEREVDTAAIEHRRMLCRALPKAGTKLIGAIPRDDCRFVQLQLCVLLQGCASVEGGGEACVLSASSHLVSLIGGGTEDGTARRGQGSARVDDARP